MNASVEIDESTRRRIEFVLTKFSQTVNRSVEEGIKDIARSSARRLIHTVKPFGVKQGIGETFEKNIGKEIDYVFHATNWGELPAASDMRTAHEAQRRKGNVRIRNLRSQSKYELRISVGDKESYAKRKIENAGMAKGAWAEAVNDLSGPKISGLGKWISRHAKNGRGKAIESGKGLQFSVELQNNVPYITDIQTEHAVRLAAVNGMKNGLNRMIKIIRKAEEKANQQ